MKPLALIVFFAQSMTPLYFGGAPALMSLFQLIKEKVLLLIMQEVCLITVRANGIVCKCHKIESHLCLKLQLSFYEFGGKQNSCLERPGPSSS